MTIEEARKAIEKYQKEHPLHFGSMLDVTNISSKEGADIISQTIERISKTIDEDTEFWCICEMAKMYMNGVKPVYPVSNHGKWICITKSTFPQYQPDEYKCSQCNKLCHIKYYFCPFCGADMRGEDNG